MGAIMHDLWSMTVILQEIKHVRKLYCNSLVSTNEATCIFSALSLGFFFLYRAKTKKPIPKYFLLNLVIFLLSNRKNRL